VQATVGHFMHMLFDARGQGCLCMTGSLQLAQRVEQCTSVFQELLVDSGCTLFRACCCGEYRSCFATSAIVLPGRLLTEHVASGKLGKFDSACGTWQAGKGASSMLCCAGIPPTLPPAHRSTVHE
jgi:hypothetical protein